MSIKQRIDAQTDALTALLEYANDATGAGDADIGEAIRTLVDGYGKGGESSTLLGEGDVTPTVEDYAITFGDNIDLPQDKSIAYVIYDDGTSGAVSGRTYMIAYAYGYLDKDLFEWKPESATYQNRLYPKMRFPLKFNDGDIPAWSDSQTYAQSGGAVIRSSSGTFYTGLSYGALRYNIDSKNFTISRGNSGYSFTPNRTYHYKVYAIGDSTGGGSGGLEVHTEIPTQDFTTAKDFFESFLPMETGHAYYIWRDYPITDTSKAGELVSFTSTKFSGNPYTNFLGAGQKVGAGGIAYYTTGAVNIYAGRTYKWIDLGGII